MRANEITKRLIATRNDLTRKDQRRVYLLEQLDKERDNLSQLDKRKAINEEATNTVLQYLEQGRKRSKTIFQEIATTFVQSVFGEEYGIEIQYDEKRGSSTAEIRAILPNLFNGSAKDGEDPVTVSLLQRGGGLIDLVNFALTLSMMELMQPRVEGPLLVDEGLKFLNVGRHDRCGEVLRSTLNPDGLGSEGEGRQLIMATHAPIFCNYADKIFEVTKVGDHSVVKELSDNE